MHRAVKTVGSLFIITIGRIGDTQHNGRLVVVLRRFKHSDSGYHAMPLQSIRTFTKTQAQQNLK